MADYVLSAKGTYDGDNFDKGIKKSSKSLDSFKGKCSTMSIAVGNILSNLASAGFNALCNSIDDAIARVDTLNQFPKVMKNLGYETSVSEAAIKKMSDGIEGLPTTLNEIVGNTQALTLSLGDMGQATDVALALNDGFLTFGASSDQVTNAITQLNQMITAGKYDMQSWNSINQSAPGFLDAVARSMLGAEAKAANLRDALNDGNVSSEDFLNTIVKLDKEGTDGIVAFSESARDAVGGIETSMTNVKTAVTKNLANLIDAVNDEGAISGMFDGIKDAINGVGKSIQPLAEDVGDALENIQKGGNKTFNSLSDEVDKFVNHATPFIENIGNTIGNIIDDVISGIGPVLETIAPVIEWIAEVGTMLVSVTVSGIGSIIGGLSDACRALSGTKSVTQELEEAVTTTANSFEKEAHAIDQVDIDKIIKEHSDLAEQLKTLREETNTSCAMLDDYGDTIENLAGRSDLTQEEVAELQIAVDGVNDSCGTSYTVAKDAGDAYQIMSDGAVIAKDSIMDLIEAQETQLRLNTTNKQYEDIYAKMREDADEYAKSVENVQTAQDNLDAKLADLESAGYVDGMFQTMQGEWVDMAKTERDALATAEAARDKMADILGGEQSSLNKLTEQRKLATMATQEGASELIKAAEANTLFQAGVQNADKDLVGFTESLAQMGFTAKQVEDMSEEQANAIAQSWGGTADQMIAACQNANVEVPAALMEMGSQSIAAMMQTSDAWRQAASDIGISVDEMAQKMSSMGFSTQELASLSAEDIQVIVDNWNGSTDQIIAALENAHIQVPEKLRQIAQEGAEALNQPEAFEQSTRNDGNAATEGFNETIGSMPQNAAETTDETVQNLDASDEAYQASSNTGQAGEQGFQDGGSGIPDVGNEQTAGYIQEIQSAGDAAAAAADTISKLVADHLSSATVDAWWAGHNIIAESFAPGIDDGRDAAVLSADTASKQVADHFSNSNVDAWWAGYNITAESFAPGIDAGRDIAVSSADTASKHVADHFSNSNGDAWWAGYNMTSGFAQGISSGQYLATAAAGAVAQAALNRIKEVGRQGSPWKTTIEMGKFAAEGLADGLKAGTNRVKTESGKLANTALEPLSKAEKSAWVSGRQTSVNYADGLSSGLSSVKSSASSLSSAVGDAFDETEAYLNQLAASYKGATERMAQASNELGEIIWNTVSPEIMKEQWTKPIMSAAETSSAALQKAGYDIDEFRKKQIEMLNENSEWAGKVARHTSGEERFDDSDWNAYWEFLDEYKEFQKLADQVTASNQAMLDSWEMAIVKTDLIEGQNAADDMTSALKNLSTRGIVFTKEFVEEFAEGSDDYQAAFKKMATLTDEEIGIMVEAYNDLQRAERLQQIETRELWVNSLKILNEQGQEAQDWLLDFRETVIDVKEALYSNDSLYSAFEMVGGSVEGLALDLQALGVSMEDFLASVEDYVNRVSNGFSAMTLDGQTSLETWERNLKANIVSAQQYAADLEAVFSNVSPEIDADAFRKAVYEGGYEQWGQVIHDMANASADQVTSAIELYNTSISEAQALAIEQFQAISPGEELVMATIEAMQEQTPLLESTTTEAAQAGASAALSVEPEYYSTGVSLAQGIAAGIQSQISSIAAAAAATVRAAISAARAEAAIASPSKVMRDEVGLMLGKGMAVGITKSTSTVVDSMKSLVDSVTDVRLPNAAESIAGSYAFNTGTIGNQSGGDDVSYIGGNTTVYVTVNKDVDIDNLLKKMNIRQNTLIRAGGLG